ncbi:MAG: phosphotransferase [Deltaproteobacteria bacterium]|nr:phosphotransferase [Deltaproteobacteria bacterium]
MQDSRVLAWLERRVRRTFSLNRDVAVSLSFPLTGARTPVAIARWGEASSAVVKLFDEITRFVSCTFHLRYLQSRGLPVPGLLSWSVASRGSVPRRYLSIEEFVSGRTLDELAPEERAGGRHAIARSLAALHGCRRRSWGRVGAPRTGSYARTYAGLALDRLGRLERDGPVDALGRLAVELRGAARQIPRPGSYAMIHGHVNPGNFLIDGANASLIDVGSAHYGDAARDLVRALHRLCPGREEARKFMSDYFAVAGEQAREEFTRAEPLYACDYVLRGTRGLADAWWREGTHSAAEIHEGIAARVDQCFEMLRPGGTRFVDLWPEARLEQLLTDRERGAHR